MQIKLNYVYLYFFLLIILLPFSLLANENPMEYRGVKLGMSIDEISSLESVKTGYMPNPKKLKCLKGEYVYSVSSGNIFLSQERQGKDKKDSIFFLHAPSNGVLICKGIRSKRFKLTGATNLWSDNIEYYFYKNKLFELDVDYYPLKYKNSNKEIKHSLDNLLKRLNENDNIVPIAKWSSSSLKSKEYDRMNAYYDFKSKLNENIEIRIVAHYQHNKVFGLKTTKKYTQASFILWDKDIIKSLNKSGEILLSTKINSLKAKNKQKKIISNQKKKQKDRLKKKYDY